MDSKETKILQRKTGISARKSLGLELSKEYSQFIAQSIVASSFYIKASTILSYQPFGEELDITFFNKQVVQDEKRLAFPICHGNGEMIAAIPFGPNSWEIGKYGITAPVESLSTILNPAEIDLVIVPCTAFDGKRCTRVGMGGGYYDRYLPKCLNTVSIAVAYEVQHIPDLYTDVWDAPLDAVVTEKNWYCRLVDQ